jgi:hypothetical protein
MVLLWRFGTSLLGLLLLTACASVSIEPLDASGNVDYTKAPGLRYYMPKPYLLVTVIPGDKPTVDPHHARIRNDAPSAVRPEAGTPPDNNNGNNNGDGTPKPAQTGSPSSNSDLSYQIGNTTYLLKLVYLPDMSKTMAINITPSILGTSSMQPTLADGWMLTSLQASADNTKALDDMTTLASAILGGGAKTASPTNSNPVKPKLTASDGPPNELPPALSPGLYEFIYYPNGVLQGLCAISAFSTNGIKNDRNSCFPISPNG